MEPTWCHLISREQTTLIDTRRFGKVDILEGLLSSTGTNVNGIDRIIITHSHEDHDGNLADLLSKTSSQLWAHPI
nr:MBL fold metallo-hydrolase [Desulfobacterales bacterium]